MRIRAYAIFWIVCTSNYAISQINYADSQISYLFSHGLVDSNKQAFNYLKSSQLDKPYILEYPLITFDYPDVSTGIFKINRLQTSLAQDNEIERLAQVYSCLK